MPGLSGTPITEIFASSRLNAMPEMIACSMVSSSSNVISVPGTRGLRVLERRQHAQLDLVLARELDRADLQHLRAQARHLEHFLEGDGVEPPRLGNDARIGRVDAVDVGVDLALVGLERGGQRHAGRVRAAAAERRDVAFRVDALEAGDDDDRARVEVAAHRALVDLEDARLGERVVGQDAHLPAGVALAPASPISCSAIASRPIVTCSPVAATTSSSRGSGLRRELLRQRRAAGWFRRTSPTRRRRAGAPARW